MKYFIDTEFVEKPGTIDLISIGIMAENGLTYYALNKNCNIQQAWENDWIKSHVLFEIYEEFKDSVYQRHYEFTLAGIKDIFYQNGIPSILMKSEIIRFTSFDDHPEFYGYYADYDWVVFCWIFGRMIDLPDHFPMYCRDLKQMMDDRGLIKEWKQEHCPDPVGEHNALVDARWNLRLYNAILAEKTLLP
jgi:hypothetical protein